MYSQGKKHSRESFLVNLFIYLSCLKLVLTWSILLPLLKFTNFISHLINGENNYKILNIVSFYENETIHFLE